MGDAGMDWVAYLALLVGFSVAILPFLSALRPRRRAVMLIVAAPPAAVLCLIAYLLYDAWVILGTFPLVGVLTGAVFFLVPLAAALLRPHWGVGRAFGVVLGSWLLLGAVIYLSTPDPPPGFEDNRHLFLTGGPVIAATLGWILEIVLLAWRTLRRLLRRLLMRRQPPWAGNE